MKIALSIAAMLALATGLTGCNKQGTPDKGTSHARPAQHNAPADELEQARKTIELQAQRAKHDIDQITADAENALEGAEHNVTSKTQQHVNQLKQHAADITGKARQNAAQLQELSAELAEDAKDRAEDVPDAVSEEVTRQLDRFKLPKRHPSVEEESASESENPN